MERLRDRMARKLRVRGMAERTVSAYVDDVRLLVERTWVHPVQLTEEGIKAYRDDLPEFCQVAPSTFAQHVAAMRFFFAHVVQREFPILPEARARRRRVLPAVLTDGAVQAGLHAGSPPAAPPSPAPSPGGRLGPRHHGANRPTQLPSPILRFARTPQRSPMPRHGSSGLLRPRRSLPRATPRHRSAPAASSQPLNRPPPRAIITASRGDRGPFSTP